MKKKKRKKNGERLKCFAGVDPCSTSYGKPVENYFFESNSDN